MSDYFGKIQAIANSMWGCDEQLTGSKVVKVLRTLNPGFDHIVVAIEESKDLNAMTVEELQNSLEAHEQWLISRKGKKIVEQVFQAQTSNRGRGRTDWKKRGRGR